MQELALIDLEHVDVQTSDITYADSYENYLKDGGSPLPEGINDFDYNKTLKFCFINGELQENYFNEYGENAISLVQTLLDNQQTRQEQENEQAEQERLEKLTLEEYKQERQQDLRAITDLFENSLNRDMYFVSSLGFKVNGDRRTLTNITNQISLFDQQAQEGYVQYRDFDNVLHKLTKEQMQTMYVEHVINGNNLYQQKWAYQEKINAAQTKDELKAMEFIFTMTDFSGGAADAQS